jgi:hypothetical protein
MRCLGGGEDTCLAPTPGGLLPLVSMLTFFPADITVLPMSPVQYRYPCSESTLQKPGPIMW